MDQSLNLHQSNAENIIRKEKNKRYEKNRQNINFDLRETQDVEDFTALS